MNQNKPTCTHCSHELTFIEGRFDYYGYCPECFNFEGIFRDRGDCCINPGLEMVKHTIKDGRIQIKKQCCYCGVIHGHCYPFKTVDNIEALPSSSRTFQEVFRDKRMEELSDMRKRVLKMFEEKFGAERWTALSSKGSNKQRPLWASTGVKDPAYPDTQYVVELIAPETVNTMPQSTLDALIDHGVVRGNTISGNYAEAVKALA